MSDLNELTTPAVLVDRVKLAANLISMQAACDLHRVELRPHIKTHKMVEVARRQLAVGARGLTCAKLGEAEAMLPSGVEEIFLAYSVVDPLQAPRIAALTERLRDFRVAITSEEQLPAIARVAAAAGRKLSVMMAIDTGLGREGLRNLDSAQRLAAQIARSTHLELTGFYTHEGHFYGVPISEQRTGVARVLAFLHEVRDAIDPALPLWPGCSVTARLMAELSEGRVQAVRPGSYVFGDISLARTTEIMAAESVALQVLATVIDKPEPGLALIDAGSKTFSSDRTASGIFAMAADRRDLQVLRVNEEHGYLRGQDVDHLKIGEKILFIPAHVCTVVNLTDQVVVTEAGQPVATWNVDARGRTR